jgi:trehalose 6-phosphate phosphatase
MEGVPTGFWGRLLASPQCLLMLDYDGTLAPFTPDRNHAWPYPGVNDALTELSWTQTRVVIISGRQAKDVVRLLPAAEQLEVWGCHGLERRRVGGACEYGDLAAETVEALAEAERLAEEQHLADQLEGKSGCLALHWRGLPPASAAQVARMGQVLWHRFDGAAGLRLHEFDGGVELRSELANKARAVQALLAEVDSDALVTYLGDDATDEDAFAALPPTGLSVLVRPEHRSSQAQAWLRPPHELISFLRQWGETRVNSSARTMETSTA